MMTPATSFRSRLERLLRVEAESKPAIYAETFDSAELADLNYLLSLLLSAGIATLGLVLNSPAVVIGAMLISPLMGPILAGGLALAAADVYLGLKSVLNILASVGLTVGFSALLVWLLPFQSPTEEILARTQPTLLDLGVALFSGLAGAIVVSRGTKAGGVSALPGVAVAVALTPPLCTVGFGVGSGFSGPIIYGAGLLFLTNLAAIVASAFLVFYIVRMDTPVIRSSLAASMHARASRDRLYRALQRTRFATAFSETTRGLGWRIVMILAVLLVLFVPLRRGLLQVRDETLARTAVRDVVRSLTPASNVLAQTVDVAKDRVSVRLIVTAHIDPARIAAAERMLLRRTGKDATIAVRRVAAEEELTMLRAELTRPAPAPPPPPPPPLDIDRARQEMLARIDGPLKEVWPADTAPMQSYDLLLTADGVVVTVAYQAKKDLDPILADTLTRFLQTRLKLATISVVLKRERVPRTSTVHGKPGEPAPPGPSSNPAPVRNPR
jgi:uncharacterized hydrophobic protein (TIGR00271 family)